MKKTLKKLINGSVCLAMASVVMVSCKKENQNDLPGTSPGAYEGKIDGFDSSEQIYRNNLVAYWSFDDTKNEKLSGTAPTSSSNDSYVAGVRGKAVSLNDGWIYYGTQLNAFKTANLKSWTVSEWVKLNNNGSTPTMIFQLTRPGQDFGAINSLSETGQNPSTECNKMVIKAVFAAENGGTQDNLNAPWLPGFKSPQTCDKWINIVTTYDYVGNNLQIWANGVMIGATDYQNRGSNYFKAVEPGGVIIGGWPQNVNPPGGAQSWQVPMKGVVDEIRVFNTVLGAAHIKALYNLGLAGQ